MNRASVSYTLDLLNVHKSDNLDEMEPSLEGHNLPRVTQEETDYLDKLMPLKGIESIIITSQIIKL